MRIGKMDSDRLVADVLSKLQPRREEVVLRPGAVSYTHLDVYKRQDAEPHLRKDAARWVGGGKNRL